MVFFIWSAPGEEKVHGRNVFKFKLIAVEGEEDFNQPVPENPITRQSYTYMGEIRSLEERWWKMRQVWRFPTIFILITLFLFPKVAHQIHPIIFNYFVGGTILKNEIKLNRLKR